MLTSLIRDAPLVPSIERLLEGGFQPYLGAVTDILMAGRRTRGAAARRTRAAVGHALAFGTWRSLVREQGLDDADAIALMAALVAGAGAARRRAAG